MSSQDESKTEERSKESEWKKMKLVSIAFKEASLDTPSFRASVNYFQTRIEIFEEWIEKFVDYMDNKYTASLDDFQRAHNTFISLLLPSPMILSNGFVANQVNTPTLVESFNVTYLELCDVIFKTICEKDFGSPTALLELMNTAIEPYKAERSNFEYYQTKYDNTLGKYQAMKVSNTSVEPSTIREDAFKVYEVRKEYLKASLELLCSISNMKLAIDKFLLEVMRSIQSRTSLPIKELGKSIDLSPTMTSNLNDYSRWIESATESSKILAPDMQHAKNQVMDYSLSRLTPSKEVNDYNVKSLNFSSLQDKKAESPKISPEKSGWLYMKTTVGAANRVIWVRRWCFLKNSVFGLFLLSSSKTSVEETDKFGVSLTTIRYDPDEDRKFCFEVKIIDQRASDIKVNEIKDIRLVFQAESLQELKAWLNIFDASKKYASKLNSNSAEYEMAYKRFSPEFLEFASSAITSIDQSITTCDENTISIMNTADLDLVNLYMDSSSGHKSFQYSLAITPISTRLTQVAVIANLYKKGHKLPNAILANIWGTANWCDYSLYDEAQANLFKTSSKKHRSSDFSTVIDYPDFYPNSMKVNDIQFKSLFFTINQKLNQFPDELLLFNFSAFWCPNKRQKFSANCYVTMDHLYCYMNSMGFICLTHRSLSDLVSVEVDNSANNLIKIYDVKGVQLRMFVYFIDRHLLAAKLRFLLENKALMHPKKEEDIFKKLNQMDSEHQETLKKVKLADVKVLDNGEFTEDSFSNKLCKSFWPKSETANEITNRRKAIQRDYSVMYRHAYDVPSKCLMHLLYGDQSTAFPRSLFLATKDNNANISGNWTEHETASGGKELVRELEFELNMTDGFLSNLHTGKPRRLKLKQRISRMIENKYYEVSQDPVVVKVPFCRPLRASAKHLILETHEVQSALEDSTSSCLLFIFYKLNFINPVDGAVLSDLTPIENWTLRWAAYFTGFEYISIRRIVRYYLEKIGKHGKTIKAIKVCGMIGVSENSQTDEVLNQKTEAGEIKKLSATENVDVDVYYPLSVIFKVILKMIGYRITNLAFVFIRLLFGWLVTMVSNVTHINRTLLLGLMISIIVNLFLSGRSSIAYWSVKRAETIFDDYMTDANEDVIQRSISICDLDLLATNLAYETDNLPLMKFNETHSAETYKYKASRNEISARRNDLLVELKILQNMERELVQDQYRKFLLSELDKCQIIQDEFLSQWSNDSKLQDYCQSCRGELYRLSTLLL